MRCEVSATLGMLLLLAACSSTSSTEPRERSQDVGDVLAPGCYTLTLGAWSAPHEATDPPDVFRLTDKPVEGVAGHFLIQPIPGRATWDYPMAWWRPSENGGSIVFSGGYVGVTMQLTTHDRHFQGQAEAFTDIAPSLQARADATLHGITCP